MRFNVYYFIVFVVFFIIEVLIALYVKDDFVRPYLGDTFVVILMYCFVRAFLRSPIFPTIVAVLLFSYGIETMQYFKLVELLGLADYTLARVVIGTAFSWGDILAYTVGAIIIWTVEYYRSVRAGV